MKKANLILFVVALIAVLSMTATAWAYETPIISGSVWLDENHDGAFDEGPAAGIPDVQVVFYRDYDCNGAIDGSDEIFDYDFSGADGYYMVVNAYYCYVGFLNEETVPEGLVYTTDPIQSVVTGQQDVLDVNFGLAEPVVDDFALVCPEKANWWKKEFKKNKNFSTAELAAIVDVALDMQPVFRTYNDIAQALILGDDADKEEKAERQFAALTLNLAVAELHNQVDPQMGIELDNDLYLPDLTNAAFVGEAYLQIEGYLLSGKNVKQAKKIAKAINQGEGLEVVCQ